MAISYKEKVFDTLRWRVIRQTEDRFDIIIRGDYLTIVVPIYYSDEEITRLMDENAKNICQAIVIGEQMGEEKSAMRIHPENYAKLLEEAEKKKKLARRSLKSMLEAQALEMKIEFKAVTIQALDERLSDSNPAQQTIQLDYLLSIMPEEEVKAYMIHELCHMRYPSGGHSDEFRDEEERWNQKSDQLYDLEYREQQRLKYLIFGNCNVYDHRF